MNRLSPLPFKIYINRSCLSWKPSLSPRCWYAVHIVPIVARGGGLSFGVVKDFSTDACTANSSQYPIPFFLCSLKIHFFKRIAVRKGIRIDLNYTVWDNDVNQRATAIKCTVINFFDTERNCDVRQTNTIFKCICPNHFH